MPAEEARRLFSELEASLAEVSRSLEERRAAERLEANRARMAKPLVESWQRVRRGWTGLGVGERRKVVVMLADWIALGTANEAAGVAAEIRWKTVRDLLMKS